MDTVENLGNTTSFRFNVPFEEKSYSFPSIVPIDRILLWGYERDGGRIVISFFSKDSRTNDILNRLPFIESEPEELLSNVSRFHACVKDNEQIQTLIDQLPLISYQLTRQSPFTIHLLKNIADTIGLTHSACRVYQNIAKKVSTHCQGDSLEDKTVEELFSMAKGLVDVGYEQSLLSLGKSFRDTGNMTLALRAFKDVSPDNPELFQQAKLEQAMISIGEDKDGKERANIFKVLTQAGDSQHATSLRRRTFNELCGGNGLTDLELEGHDIKINAQTLVRLAKVIKDKNEKIMSLESELDNQRP